MKSFKRLLALLLCGAMILSMAACETTPAKAEPTQTTAPTTEPTEPEPTPAEIYTQARAAVDSAEALTLEIRCEKSVTVGDSTFTEESEQTVSYVGLGTEQMQLESVDTITYGAHNEVVFQEIYSAGTLYISVSDTCFCGTMTPEESMQRYAPAVVLDASLYGSITAEAIGNSTTLTFSEPTAGESWAVPDDGELVEASGSAVINQDGSLRYTAYLVTYHHGNAQITLDIRVYPEMEVGEITVPEDAESFILLEHVDALRLSTQALGFASQADAYYTSTLESIFCQAAGIVRNQSQVLNVHGKGSAMMAKVESGIFFMDYSTHESQHYEQEEIFRDGNYTISVDGEEPVERSGITAAVVQNYCDSVLLSYLSVCPYWETAVITDLGSLYLIESTFVSEIGDQYCDTICTMLWNDPEYLDNLATAYVNNEVSGYFAVDKYTGLPTSAGFYYEGTHTLYGDDYILTMQSDQSLHIPSLEAYKELTDELEPETEPENKATPLFYHVTGENGQEMWLLGTIHVGDERTAFLPQEIYDAFDASDALALEFNLNAFEDRLDEDEEFSDRISDYYYYSDGPITEHIDEELFDQAVLHMKATGNYTMNSDYLKAAIWANSIENFYHYQGFTLLSDKGVDNRLLTMAEEQGKEVLEVESGEFQVGMSTGYSDELQAELLKEAIETNAPEYWESVMELYELWCTGDEAAMREALSDEVDLSELTEEELAEYEQIKPLLDEYNTAMSYDRNEDMLQVAIDYLESGKTVFYAVGLAHLLDEANGLVDTLREAGYTVELVEYAQ